MKLTPIERQIYELVRKRSRTVDDIIAQIWWIHPQDAPQRNNIKAHIWSINRKLRGERIRSSDWGGSPRTGEREGLYHLHQTVL